MNVCLPDVATFVTLNVMIYEIMTTSILIGKLRYEFPLSAEYICRYQLEIVVFTCFDSICYYWQFIKHLDLLKTRNVQ